MIEGELISLQDLQGHFIDLYGLRNNVWLPGRLPRINLLNVALGDLQEAIRKGSAREHLEATFARIPSRIFCIAHGINNVSVALAMMEKYPLDGCAYCHSNPCQCREKRPEARLSRVDLYSPQHSWRLWDWQHYLDSLYGQKNRERGVENAINRSFKEIAELMNLEHEIPRSRLTRQEIEHEYSLELADCLAWTIALSNIVEVDLEKATLDRFWPRCWNCQGKPCICQDFSFKPIHG